MDGAIMQQIQPAVAGCAQARSFSRLLGSRPVARYSVWPGYGTAKAVPLRKKQNQIHCENTLRQHGPRTKLGVLRFALCRLAPSRSLRMTVLFLLDRDLAQEFEVAEHLAGAENHAGQGIIGDGDRQ